MAMRRGALRRSPWPRSAAPLSALCSDARQTATPSRASPPPSRMGVTTTCSASASAFTARSMMSAWISRSAAAVTLSPPAGGLEVLLEVLS